MSQATTRHLTSIDGAANDEVKRRDLFLAAHSEVTIGFHGGVFSAQWPESDDGKLSPPISRFHLRDLMDELERLFPTSVVPIASSHVDAPASPPMMADLNGTMERRPSCERRLSR